MNLLVELFTNLFDALLAVLFVTLFSKISFKKVYFSLPAVLLIFSVSTLFLFVENESISIIHSVLITGILYAYCFLCRPKERLRFIFAPLVFEVTLIINNSFFLSLFSFLFGRDIGDLMVSGDLSRYLLILGSKISLVTLLLLILKMLSLSGIFSATGLLLYLVSPVFTVYVLYVFMDIGQAYILKEYLVKIIVAVIFLAIINIFTVVLFEISNKNAESRRKYDLLEKQLQLERENYTAMIAANEKLQKVKHDIKNHLIYIRKIVDSNETGKLNEYIDSVSRNLQETDKYMVTSNRILDYILSTKIAENRNINFMCVGDCFFLLDHLEELDVAILFGNLLDNAIEAAGKVENKLIEIRVARFHDFLNIYITNSVDESVLRFNPELRSTKSDPVGHGWGLRNVRSIVDRYGGMFDCYEKNNRFTVHVCIPLPSEPSEIGSV